MEGKEIFGNKYGENSIRSDCRLKTQGMSDLFMHECVDISWDDYFLNDDRIVPHHGSKRLNEHFIPGEQNKRCRHELVSSTNNTGGSANKYVDYVNEIPPPLSKTRNTMLDKDTWSHKEASSLACESSSELVQPDMIDFPIGDVNHTSNGIFGNAENKDSSDLLYSAWSEVENLDDIERMFRTDPTLGLGISKEDEMSWLSSANDVGESGDVLNSDAKFPAPDVKTISINHDSYSCLENPVSNIHSRDNHLSYDSYPSIVKSETPMFSTDSVHASSQMQYMDGFAGPPFKETGPVVSGQREKLQSCQNRRGVIQSRISNTPLVGTYENHYDSQESSLANASEMDSSSIQERSTAAPDLDDVSLEAASFRQLQHVTKQLDLRTKICIRDSLYRLAHSAEQRRSNPNLHNTFGDKREAAGGTSEAEGTNRCSSFTDMETDTNPIDRSVAHLLFNRPSDSSATIGSA